MTRIRKNNSTMSTIRGENISLVKPSLIFQPRATKRTGIRPSIATRKVKCYKPVAVSIMLKCGGIRSLCEGTHCRVCEVFSIDPDNVDKLGWRLNDGEYMWR